MGLEGSYEMLRNAGKSINRQHWQQVRAILCRYYGEYHQNWWNQKTVTFLEKKYFKESYKKGQIYYSALTGFGCFAKPVYDTTE